MIAVMFSTLLTIIIILIVIRKTLYGKPEKKPLIIAAVVLGMLYALPLFFISEPMDQNVVVLGTLVYSLIMPLYVFRGISKSQCFYIAILVQGLIVAISISLGWITSIVLEITIDGSLVDLFTNLVLLSICILTNKRGLLSGFINSIRDIPRRLKVLLVSSVWISATVIGLTSMTFQAYPDLPLLAYSGVFTAALIILVGIMCPLLIMNNLSSSHYKKLSELMNKQVLTQLEHYETMSKLNEDIRKFQHDYKNVRIGLISYLKQDDVSGALDYLNAERLSIKSPANTFETGCVILDALLNEKQISAASVNTKIEFEGAVPENLLNPADICIIFGNSLDNAIEACAKLPAEEQKVITVQSEFSKDFLFIKIENPTANNVQINNNYITTAKENRRAHGIGLQSIKASVAKYSGVMKLTCVNNIFSVAIDLDFHH